LPLAPIKRLCLLLGANTCYGPLLGAWCFRTRGATVRLNQWWQKWKSLRSPCPQSCRSPWRLNHFA